MIFAFVINLWNRFIIYALVYSSRLHQENNEIQLWKSVENGIYFQRNSYTRLYWKLKKKKLEDS